MSKNGPIIVIEDDEDDHEILVEVFNQLQVKNTIKLFADGESALEYLRKTKEIPFIILCDINMPKINGLQLRSVIDLSPTLRKKAIPFIFLSTTADRRTVDLAYELTVQGFFEKASDFNHMKEQLKLIIDYWSACQHPNLELKE